MDSPVGAPGRRRLKDHMLRLTPLALIGCLYAFLLGRSWERWADIHVDFGRELYIPWQMAEGKVLYRDIAHLFGPLSQSFNALVFKLFGGPSYALLFTTDILLLGLFAIYLYHFVARRAGYLAATAAVAMFMVLNGVTQQYENPNFNFLSPYSHEAIHGLMLAFLLFGQLAAFHERGRRRSLIVGGLLLGLVFMTKTELAAASLAATLWFFLFPALLGRKPLKQAIRELGLLLAFALVPGFLFFLHFASRMGFPDALKAMLEPWRIALFTKVSRTYFYQIQAGFTDFWGRSLAMLTGSAVYLGVVAVAWFTGHRRSKTAFLLQALAFLAAIDFMLVFSVKYFERALTVFTLAMVVALALRQRKGAAGRDDAYDLIFSTIGVFGLGLMARLAVFSRFAGYGFYLTVPTVILLSTFSLKRLPEILEGRNGKQNGFRWWAALLLALVVWSQGEESLRQWAEEDVPVGSGQNSFYVKPFSMRPEYAYFTAAIDWLEKNTGRDETLVVLPEGIMLNYLTGRVNPTRHINFMPPEVMVFEEEKILEDFRRHPPDVIALIIRPMPEYGVERFGTTEAYGRKIALWVNDNYRVAGSLTMKFEPEGRPGVVFFRRQPRPKAG